MVEARVTLSIQNACATVRVSRRTIYNWPHEGLIEYKRTAGGSIRIFEDTLFWRDGDIRPTYPALPLGPQRVRSRKTQQA